MVETETRFALGWDSFSAERSESDCARYCSTVPTYTVSFSSTEATFDALILVDGSNIKTRSRIITIQHVQPKNF